MIKVQKDNGDYMTIDAGKVCSICGRPVLVIDGDAYHFDNDKDHKPIVTSNE